MQTNEWFDLECTVISGRPEQGHCSSSLYSSAFLLWQETWQNEIYKAKFTSDAFFNSKNIILLHRHGSVKALGVFNEYDLKHLVYRYAAYLDGIRDLELINNNDNFFTIEYLSVRKEWRSLKVGAAAVLIGLIQKAFLESQATFIFGTARKIFKVPEVGEKFGFTNYGSIDRYGLDCSVMVGNKSQMRPHPDQKTADQIDCFWSNKNKILEFKKTAA